MEITLLVLPQCHVYKLPPRQNAQQWICQNWGNDAHIWSGRLRITEKGPLCFIHLEDEQGALFATCPVDNDNLEASVEPVADSSRYFVLRVTQGQARAFLGLGFQERSVAFDFNCTLADHIKSVRREAQAQLLMEKEANEPPQPSVDRSLQSNVTISLPGRKANQNPPEHGTSQTSTATSAGIFLAPPPTSGGGGPRRKNAPQQAQAVQTFSSESSGWATFG